MPFWITPTVTRQPVAEVSAASTGGADASEETEGDPTMWLVRCCDHLLCGVSSAMGSLQEL